MGDKITPYALASETGVPQPTIFRILTGESNDPRTKTLQPLAMHFGITVADLRDRDLSSPQAEHIRPNETETVDNGVSLDARQHEWLDLLNHLGSDDVAEFSALIRSRQERNVRLMEELRGKVNQHNPTDSSRNLLEDKSRNLFEDNSRGKRQRSQSS